jgi:autotransporter-associated beta strand protein
MMSACVNIPSHRYFALVCHLLLVDFSPIVVVQFTKTSALPKPAMKKFLTALSIATALTVSASYAQTEWSYDFGTSTGTFSSGASTTFLPAPEVDGGTARVRVGTQGGSFQLTSVEGFGSGSALVGTAATGGSVNKFSIYEWADPTSTFSMGFDMRLGGGDSGVWNFLAGNGASFSNNSALANTEIFSGLRMGYGASGALSVSNRSGGGWVAFADTGIVRNENLSLSIFGNNSSASTSYFFNDETFTLASNTWDLWVDGVRIAGVAKGALGADVNINSFMFYGESSTGNVATISLDNFIYMNGLEPPPPPPVAEDLYWSGAGGWASTPPGDGGSGSWNNGDGAWNSASVANFAGTAGAVTVDTVTAEAGIKFTADGYTLSGGTVTLAGGSAAINTVATDGPVSATISSTLAGTAGLTKAGNGTLVLSGANTFSGGVSVDGGLLSIGSNNNLGDAANTVTLSGGTLLVTEALSLGRDFVIGPAGGTVDTDGNNVGIGSLSGGGSFTKAGEGVLTATNFSAAGLNITGGTLVLNPTTTTLLATGDNAGTLVLGTSVRYNFANGTHDGAGVIEVATTGTSLATTGTANAILKPNIVLNSTNSDSPFSVNIGAVSGTTLTVDSVISGSSGVRFSAAASGGAGVVVLNAANTYTGNTEINTAASGVVRLGVANALPTTTGVTWGITANSGFIDLNGHDQTLAYIANAGTFVTGGMTNSSVTQALLTINQSTTTTFNSVLSGNLSMSKQGSGTLTLAGANSYTGPTTVIEGRLNISGSVNSNVTVGDGATLAGKGTINGNLSFESGANFVFDLTGPLVVNNGNVSFDGFGISNLSGLTSATELGTYTLITGTGSATFDFLGLSNFGEANKASLGDDKFAFFKEGSLQVEVIPEPSTYALLTLSGIALAGYAIRRRRRAGH